MSRNTRPYLISIFMPVYNGSKYLEKSIGSVLKQTFKSFELICVDDSSTDNSYEILKKYAETDSRIKVFQKPNGGTVPKCWNFVMPYLKGNSITYMSQDDLMSEDNLEQMYKRQQVTGADCVLPDMVWYYEGEQENKIIAGVNGNRDIILTNREAVVLSLDWRIHGFALWKSKIIKDEHFPEDSFNSDEYMTRKLLFKSNKVAFCNGVYFYRQDNEMALTKSFGIKNYYMILTKYRVYKLLEDNIFEPSIIESDLIKTYQTHYRLYRTCAQRKEIYSDNDFKNVRLMLFDVYRQFNKKKLLRIAKHRNGFERLKVYLIWVLYYNFSLFKILFFLIYLFDRSNEKFNTIKNRFLSVDLKISFKFYD
jgi:glycosyltransferase involved in cell wall biosynthesis